MAVNNVISPSPLIFHLSVDSFECLDGPESFRNTLQNLFSKAQNRIFVSTLYIGEGEPERHLLSQISLPSNKANKSSFFRLRFLIDYHRGTRGESNIPCISGHASTTDQLIALRNRLYEPENWNRKYEFASKSDSNFKAGFFYHPFASNRFLKCLKPLLSPVQYSKCCEVLGVMHMKVFVIDDRVIFTGANFSETYLTNRQDRYVIIHDSKIADAIENILEKILDISYNLVKSLTSDSLYLYWMYPDWPEPKIYPKAFQTRLAKLIQTFSLLQENVKSNEQLDEHAIDLACNSFDKRIHENISSTTVKIEICFQAGFVYPICDQERQAFLDIVKHASLNSEVKQFVMASGYLNLNFEFKAALTHFVRNLTQSQISCDPVTDQVKTPLLNSDSFITPHRNIESSTNAIPSVTLITSSPEANSFFQAPGWCKFIPSVYSCNAYTLIAHLQSAFQKACQKCQHYFLHSLPPRFMQYHRSNWSFHAKGIWVCDGQGNPLKTIVGSSNFGYRSLSRDFEIGCTIHTSHPTLQKVFRSELLNLLKFGFETTPSQLKRQFSFWIRFFLPFIRSFF